MSWGGDIREFWFTKLATAYFPQYIHKGQNSSFFFPMAQFLFVTINFCCLMVLFCLIDYCEQASNEASSYVRLYFDIGITSSQNKRNTNWKNKQRSTIDAYKFETYIIQMLSRVLSQNVNTI